MQQPSGYYAPMQPQAQRPQRAQSAHPTRYASAPPPHQHDVQAFTRSFHPRSSVSADPPTSRPAPAFSAFDLVDIARANERQQALQALQQAEWSATQRLFRPHATAQVLTSTRSKKLRPSSAAESRYHPLSYAVMRPKLLKSASAALPLTPCVSSRPYWTFSAAPDSYPYRFTSKPDYQLTHMSQSLDTRRDPPPVVPEMYKTLKQTWRATRQ